MPKYGNFLYGTGNYGTAPNLTYSVEPMLITVLDFEKVFIQWSSPTGTFSRIRLVRNQVGFPETAEDGVIIWEETATEETVSRTSFVDGEDNPSSIPLVSGRPVYYSMFLFIFSNVWVRAGDIYDIVPFKTSAQTKIINLLPKVFTSDIKSPLGVVDTDSAIYKFIDGFAFTYEQLTTEIDLLKPTHISDITSHLLLPIAYQGLGLEAEPSIPIKNQKILKREAFYLHSHKGLKNGIETYVEALTGYGPVITVSPNLLLTGQDSTFYNGVGNWKVNNCTLTSVTSQAPVITDYVIDTSYTGKVTAAGASYITLGADSPITKGIPVKEEVDYTFGFKVKSPLSAGNVQLTVKWHDKNGTDLASDFVLTSVAANNTWKTSWDDVTSPTNAVYASLKITFSASGEYYIDQVYAEEGVNTDNTSYQEARAVDIFLLPNKTNFIKNPSFETNVTDSWTAVGSPTVTQDTSIPDDVYAGTNSAKIVATGAWSLSSNAMPVVSGNYYSVSGYAKGTTELTLTFIGRDGSSVITESSNSYSLGILTDWTRFTASVLVDSNSDDIVTYELKLSGNAGTFYLDSLQFEKSISATEYFDGTLPADFGAVWEGTAHNSYTHMYYGKTYKIPRLSETLNDWMPPNTFWRVLSYDGLEYTSLTV